MRRSWRQERANRYRVAWRAKRTRTNVECGKELAQHNDGAQQTSVKSSRRILTLGNHLAHNLREDHAACVARGKLNADKRERTRRLGSYPRSFASVRDSAYS